MQKCKFYENVRFYYIITKIVLHVIVIFNYYIYLLLQSQPLTQSQSKNMQDSALKTKNQLARISAKINQLKKKYPTFQQTYHFTDAKVSNTNSMELKTRKSSMDSKTHKQTQQIQSRQSSCSKSYYKDELNDLKKQIISSLQVKNIDSKTSHNQSTNSRMKHITNPSIHLYQMMQNSNSSCLIKPKQQNKFKEQQKQSCKLEQQVTQLKNITNRLQESFFQLQQKLTNKVSKVMEKVTSNSNSKYTEQLMNLTKAVSKLQKQVCQEKYQRQQSMNYLMTEIKQLKENMLKNQTILQNQQLKFRSQFDSISFASLPIQNSNSQQDIEQLQTKINKEIFDIRNEIQLIYHKIDQEQYRNKALKTLSLNSNRSSNKQNNGGVSASSSDQKKYKFQQKIQKQMQMFAQKIQNLQQKLNSQESLETQSFQIFSEYSSKVATLEQQLKNVQESSKTLLISHYQLEKQHKLTKVHLNQLEVKFTSFNMILSDLQANTTAQIQQNKYDFNQKISKITENLQQKLQNQSQKLKGLGSYMQGASRELVSKCDYIWNDVEGFKGFCQVKWLQINELAVQLNLFLQRFNDIQQQQKTRLNQTSQKNKLQIQKVVRVQQKVERVQQKVERVQQKVERVQQKVESLNQRTTEKDTKREEQVEWEQLEQTRNKSEQLDKWKQSVKGGCLPNYGMSFLQELTKNSLVLSFALEGTKQ